MNLKLISTYHDNKLQPFRLTVTHSWREVLLFPPQRIKSPFQFVTLLPLFRLIPTQLPARDHSFQHTESEIFTRDLFHCILNNRQWVTVDGPTNYCWFNLNTLRPDQRITINLPTYSRESLAAVNQVNIITAKPLIRSNKRTKLCAWPSDRHCNPAIR